MIFITKYNCNWPILFEDEKKRIDDSINQWILSIEHVGSTSIPEMSAKPIIDILIGVESLKAADDYILPAMKNLGYLYIKEYESMLPNRRYFKLKAPIVGYNVHLVEQDTDFYKDMLLFKNILLNNPTLLSQYQQLKFELMKKYEDAFEYANAKSEFISKVLREHRNTN